MTSWTIKRYIKVILALHMAMLGLMGLAELGLDIPVLRQIISFICLGFIPGFLLLRVLRLQKLSAIEGILYSVGLSIAFVMFFGLLVGFVLSYLTVSRPLSSLPLAIAFTVAIVILCIVAYRRDRGFSSPIGSGIKRVPLPPVLFLSLLPFLAIIGAYLSYYYDINLLLLILLGIIALVVALAAFNRFIHKEVYPWAILMIAVALLFHTTMISSHLNGADIHPEYFLTQITQNDAVWSADIEHNSTLSITILPTVYSLFSGMDAVWIYKVIWPLLFSLVPLGLYQAFRGQTNDKIAFLGVFFFMAIITFYTTMTWLAKQQIAELFFVLIVLVMLNKQIARNQTAILSMVFGISLIASHYSLAYVFGFCIVTGWLALLVMRSTIVNTIWRKLQARLKLAPGGNGESTVRPASILNPGFIVLYLVLALVWHMNFGQSSAFESATRVVHSIYDATLGEFFYSEARSTQVAVTMGWESLPYSSWQRELFRVFQYFVQIFLLIGIVKILLKPKSVKITQEFKALILSCALLVGLSIILPRFTSAITSGRVFQIALLLLSPFVIIGGETFFRAILRLFKFIPVIPGSLVNGTNGLRLTAIVLIPYFLFHCGFMYDVTGDPPSSFSLSSEKEEGVYKKQEVEGMEWLWTYWDDSGTDVMYGDDYTCLLAYERFWFEHGRRVIYSETDSAVLGAYIYLRGLQAGEGKIKSMESGSSPFPVYDALKDSTFYNAVLVERDKVYDNGTAQIYK